MTDKIRLFRLFHGIDWVYISETGALFKDKPKSFTGKWLGWDDNGQLKYEINYKDGEKHGKWLEWHANGQLAWEENYKDGERHGKWLEWYENGQLKYEENYE